MRWPANGAHHQNFEASAAFLPFRYTHTNVTHKRKVGQSVNYVRQFDIILPDGSRMEVLANAAQDDWPRRRKHRLRESIFKAKLDP